MSDGSILRKRQADSSGWDADQDRKRIHFGQPLAHPEHVSTVSQSGVLPSLSDLSGSPSPWPTTTQSDANFISHQSLGGSLENPEFFDGAYQYLDSGLASQDGYPNQLVTSGPAFHTEYFSTQLGSPSGNCSLDYLQDPMQYSLTSDSISCHLNPPSFKPIGGQSPESYQFFSAPNFQPIPTTSVDVLTVHDQQKLTPHYRASPPVVTEPNGPDIPTLPCPRVAEETPDTKADSGGETSVDTCFGVIITAPTCFATCKEQKSSVAVRLDNCGTFLKMHDQATGQYLGLLNMPALCKVLGTGAARETEKGKMAVPLSTTDYNLRVVVEGSRKDGKDVGRLLSEADLFLQHPSASERDPILEYFNPQFLICPGEAMPTLEDLAIEDEEQDLRSKQLDDMTKARLLRVFDDANVTVGNTGIDVTPSPRLRTSLMPHQLKALGMMQQRESGTIETEQFPPLWVRDQNEPNQILYRHRITGLSTRNPGTTTGGVIADDMGLGKSLTLLALICSSLDHLEETDPKEQSSASTLIVAPKSVISAWETQITRHIHVGRVKVLLYHGANRNQHRDTFGDFDVVLTTYDTLRSECTLKGPLYSHAWLRLALDEAHHIRNRQSQIFQACCEVKAMYRWCLTGTPVQNSLDDYGSLLSFLRIDPFQDKSEFDRWIAKPFYKGDKYAIDTLRCLILSTCFRRTKATVNLSNPLPERHDTVQDVTLLPSDQKMYDFFKKIIQEKVTGISRNKRAPLGKIAKHGDFLAYITTLRRICDHSQLLSTKAIETWKEGDSDDADNASILDSTTYCDMCGEACEDFTSFSSKPGPCNSCLAQGDPGSATNNSNDANVPPSAKIEALLANLQHHRTGSQGHQCPKSVVFSAWTKMLDLTQQALQARGFNCQRIDGQTSLQGRSNAMKTFDEDDACTVMLATIGSAGEGVDFTTAQYVHLLEPHWNPMTEAQAVDRVHRIGQTRPVTVVRYIVPSSIESYIQWVQEDKMRTINMSLDTISDADKAEEKRWERLKQYLK
ncbi:helicase-like transcription factor [Apiospora saccharicola]|uniref:Helicase-like transcription factor n=1 Tax=Apiospora saccharicola TaxID=335842 RepID=A0ABR1V8D0_9PEZI